MSWWIAILGAVLVFAFVGPLMRLAIAAVFGRQVADHALAKQPDTIHLVPASSDAWLDPENARQVSNAIRALGFEDAGTYTIPELAGITVELWAHAGSSTYAAIYQHARAGSWFEFFQRAGDGTGTTWTTLPATGLTDQPGHPVVRAPGSDPAALFERVRRGQAPTGLEPARVGDATRVFETGYAESVAWRKQSGVSRAEVMRIAGKRAA